MARGKGHLEWESSEAQKAAETWWTEHGFEWKHNGKYYEWICIKGSGYEEHYKCSRFEVERIERELNNE